LKRFIKDLLYIPKYEKISDKTFNTRIILSVISMIISVVILCSVTFAYFRLNISSGNICVKSAVFTIEAADRSIIGGEECIVNLQAGELVIYSNGVKGYCLIEDSLGEKACVFDEFTVSVTLNVQTDGEIKISACWGEYYENPTLMDGDVIVPFSVQTTEEEAAESLLTDKDVTTENESCEENFEEYSSAENVDYNVGKNSSTGNVDSSEIIQNQGIEDTNDNTDNAEEPDIDEFVEDENDTYEPNIVENEIFDNEQPAVEDFTAENDTGNNEVILENATVTETVVVENA